MVVSAKVVGIQVTPPDSEYHQGYKGGWSGQFYSGGAIHQRNGFGGQRDITPKRITLQVEVGDRVSDVWVDRDFRFALGKLTPKRTQAIIESLPDEVMLYENENRRGERFYCLTETSFNEWLKNSGL